MIKKDEELLKCLEKDSIALDSLKNLSIYPILENKSPKLCADRLDGVLHTCYIWLHTHPLEEVKEVYEDLTVLTNEEGNKDKYVMKYIAEVVKKASKNGWITIDDLYTKTEEEITSILSSHIPSFLKFKEAEKVISCKQKPVAFFISFTTKKRNVIPLVKTRDGTMRITMISKYAQQKYKLLEQYQDEPYAYIETILTP